MPVTILAPMSGDTVSNPVTITSGFYALTADEVICKIAANPDNKETLDGIGVHIGSGIGGVALGSHTVEVFVNNTREDFQEGVIVNGGPNPDPVPIEEVIGPETVVKEKKKKLTVKGRVPDGSAAAYVVCQAIEVDMAVRKYTAVATGAASLKEEKKWQVDLAFEVNEDDKIRYVVRAFAYDKNQRLIGSQTLYFAKKKVEKNR